MIVDWIYNDPTWLWGTIIVALFTSAACTGLLIFHRLVDVDVRRAHNDLAGFNIAIISVLYAVLLAFIAIATWESFSKASDIVENESDYVGSMYLITSGLPDETGQKIRDALANYVGVVIDDEWPIQRQGVTPDQGWKPLRDIGTAIATIQPQTSGEAVIEAQLLKTFNDLYVARSTRLSAVEGHIPGVIWAIVFFGAAITIVYTYSIRLSKLQHALGHDRHRRSHARACDSDDHSARLAVPRRDKRLPRALYNDPTFLGCRDGQKITCPNQQFSRFKLPTMLSIASATDRGAPSLIPTTTTPCCGTRWPSIFD
jgi:hypothetical protein